MDNVFKSICMIFLNVCFVQVDLRQCHYLVDLDLEEETPLEPRYSAIKEEWNVIAHKPFLQASRCFPKHKIYTERFKDF